MIILLTGPSATGKSTIAEFLGDAFQLPVLGEREILRSLAHPHGFTRTRHWLAEVGVNAVLNAALAETVRKIQEEKNEQGIILDGSYDRRLPQTLREVFSGERVLIISVAAEERIREERMMKRMGTTTEEALSEMQLIDRFKEYAGMAEIIRDADLVVENNRSIDEVMRELQIRLESEIFGHWFGPERMKG